MKFMGGAPWWSRGYKIAMNGNILGLIPVRDLYCMSLPVSFLPHSLPSLYCVSLMKGRNAPKILQKKITCKLHYVTEYLLFILIFRHQIHVETCIFICFILKSRIFFPVKCQKVFNDWLCGQNLQVYLHPNASIKIATMWRLQCQYEGRNDKNSSPPKHCLPPPLPESQPDTLRIKANFTPKLTCSLL